MIYTVTVSDKGQITLPAKLRDAMAIEYGQSILVMTEGEKISLRPLPKPPKKKKSILALSGSFVPPKGKSTDPEVAIEEMRKIKYGRNPFE